jgi:predicted GNAT superfamily acetyltransferase
MTPSVRALRHEDLDRVLEINRANTPEVGSLGSARLAFIYDESAIRLGVTVDERLIGFALVLAPGSSYDSVNYQWFKTDYSESWYLDRVAISAAHRRQGLGARLYGHIVEALAATRVRSLGLEVNIDPPNPGSLAFHERLGFEVVGQQTTDYGAVVAMMLRPVSGESTP